MSNFFTPEFNNESAIAPWNASLEPTKAIIPKLDANLVLTGGIGQEVNIPTLTPEAYDNIILPDASLTRMANGAIGDSNTSLPDSSVDLLTGQAMSEVYQDLSKFAAGPDFAAKLNVAFGENWDAAAAKALAEEWFQGDFSDIPPVKVVSSAEIAGANGAFAAATDTIYLSKEFLTGNAANPAAVADVLLEEIGHSVDARLNVTDSPGDEGAIFSRVVQGKELTQGEIFSLKTQFDGSYVTINNKETYLELSRSTRTFDRQSPASTTLSRSFGLEKATWNTEVSLSINDSDPVAGEIIRFQLTIEFKNFYNGGIPGGTTPYTVLGYVPSGGSYGSKTTEAFPSLESLLSVRNGNFVNQEDWKLRIIYNPNTETSTKQVNFGNFGSITFEGNKPESENYLALYDKDPSGKWDTIGIKNILASGSDTGKFIGSGVIQLNGFVQAEDVGSDWLQVAFQTLPIYSYNSNYFLVGAVSPDQYYGWNQITTHVYAPFPPILGGIDLSN